MRKQIDHRKCDHCGKVVEQSEMMFGGSPFNGWLRVERTDGWTVWGNEVEANNKNRGVCPEVKL